MFLKTFLSHKLNRRMCNSSILKGDFSLNAHREHVEVLTTLGNQKKNALPGVC